MNCVGSYQDIEKIRFASMAKNARLQPIVLQNGMFMVGHWAGFYDTLIIDKYKCIR